MSVLTLVLVLLISRFVDNDFSVLNNTDIVLFYYINYIDTESLLWHTGTVFNGTYNGVGHINWQHTCV